MHSKLKKLIGVYAIQHLVNLMSNLTVDIKGRRHRHNVFHASAKRKG